MELHSLPKVKTQKEHKRLGRGHSSGKGKTSGRGQKGQKARNKIRLGFEGGQTPLYKRVPFIRGKGNKRAQVNPISITLTQLSTLDNGATVTEDLLITKGFISEREAKARGVKVVGTGELTKKLTIQVAITKQAQAKIDTGKNVSAEVAP